MQAVQGSHRRNGKETWAVNAKQLLIRYSERERERAKVSEGGPKCVFEKEILLQHTFGGWVSLLATCPAWSLVWSSLVWSGLVWSGLL